LKEAALDSPTFRSSVSHFGDQVDIIEKWLDTFLRSISKVTQEANAIEIIANGFLSQIVPPANVSEAVLDHDYTLLTLNSYGEGARETWTSVVSGMRKMEANMVEPIRNLMQNDLRTFKETLRVLEQTQKVYDGLLYRYSGQTKHKEPSSLREDAFQLHEARKAYLKASLDFSVTAPQLRATLDKVLIKVLSDQWREMRNSKGNLDSTSRGWNRDIERVRSWSREVESGEATFRRDLEAARRQIEDSTEARLRPSRELEDYASLPTSINGSQAPTRSESHTGTDRALTNAEKQGWLYLRTIGGKPTRTIWVRRWFFVKNGIFGWLVQGSRSGGVEESDRIGVLLCNIRPAPAEERRFAFEVKTKDLSITLQADSQSDLHAWLKAFEVAKQKALEDPASTDSPGLEGPSQDPAFAISSPPAPEFAASAADSGMHQFREDTLTTSLERNSTLPIPAGDSAFGHPGRSSTDSSAHRRPIAVDRDGESGRDHAARIIQKLDLHRKSTGGPQLASNPGGPPPSSLALAGGGIASLIAASHNVMPVGPGALPQSPPMEAPVLRIGGSSKLFYLPPTTVAPNTLANAPAPTNLSATAVIVSGERGIGLGRSDATGGMPSGVMANVWGSSNWGYLNRLERGEVKAPQRISTVISSSPSSASPPGQAHVPMDTTERSKGGPTSRTSPPSHRKTNSLPSDANHVPNPKLKAIDYPDYYPLQLKTQDAQFKLLFPNVSRAERVVLVFRATWSLNEQQEFPGRVYITNRYIYFYSHHLGLVLTSGVALCSVSEVTAAPGREYDLLFVHLREASDSTDSTRITVKAFLEPLNLLQQRLNYLVRSCKLENPPDIDSIMKELIKFDHNDPTNSPTKDNRDDLTGTATSDDGRARNYDVSRANRDLRAAVMFDGRIHGNTHDEVRDAGKIKLPRQPVLYVPIGMGRAVVDKIFDTSSKALFHLMFGDKSALWQLLYHERHAQRRFFSVLTGLIQPGYFKALKDLSFDALDLSDLVTDQVKKLGALSRTKKAIQIFGQVGVQTQAFELAGSDAPITTHRRSMKHRSLTWLVADAAGSSVQSAILSITSRVFAIVRSLWKSINANMMLLAVLAASVLANLVFSSTGTAEWWKDRQAGRYMAKIGVTSDSTMSKAIYLRDVDEAWSLQVPTFDGSGSPCRNTFESYLSSTDTNAPKVSASVSRTSPADRAVISRLQRSRYRLGSQRHDLIVALRVINSIENELVEAEWEGWLHGETTRCRKVEMLFHKDPTESVNSNRRNEAGKQQFLGLEDADRSEVGLWHEEYCGSCFREKESLEKQAKSAGRGVGS
ncbi:MAG: hypothetical protein Q9170_007497, partial [Blastenia crenularia]